MEKKGGFLGNAILEGGIEGLVISLLHSFGRVAEEKGAKYIESKIFGIGTNDEHLFLSACAYAVKEKMITSDELIKICRVIDSFESSQRSKVIQTIGKDEIEVTAEEPKFDADGNVVTEKKTGKPVMAKNTSKANVKGAQMLEMMAKLDDDGIKKILNTSGASVSFEANLKKAVSTTATKIGNSQIKKDGESFFAKKTWLERLADDLEAKRLADDLKKKSLI